MWCKGKRGESTDFTDYADFMGAGNWVVFMNRVGRWGNPQITQMTQINGAPDTYPSIDRPNL
jgi:hypothetical protein